MIVIPAWRPPPAGAPFGPRESKAARAAAAYYTILYYTILHYTTLYYAMLCYTII